MRGEPATERSDLYSCGVVLRDCIGDGPPRRLGALAERLASDDPRGRPASAGEAIDQLGRRATVPDQPTERLRPTEPPSSAEPLRPSRPRRPAPPRISLEHRASRFPWGKAAAVGAALAMLAVALLVINGGSEEQPGKSNPGAAAADREGVGANDPAGGEEGPATVPAPAGDDVTLGSSLNQEGFEMIQAGRHEEAVPVLEEAIRNFPPGTTDLNYAYALFNLGNALRLSGRPDEAIPVLEQRLEIPNQTGVVRRELAAARRAASS